MKKTLLATLAIAALASTSYAQTSVADIAAAKAEGEGATIEITSPVVVTAVNLNVERNQFVVQDASGSDGQTGITIDDSSDTVTATLSVGDTITNLSGDISTFSNLVQIIPDVDVDPGDIGSGTVPAPLVIDSAPAGDDIESELIRLNGVEIDAGGDTNFQEDTSYDITTGAQGEIIEVRIEDGSDLIGEAIPTGSFDVIGIAKEFDNFGGITPPVISIQPRFTSDIIATTSVQSWDLY